MSCAVQDGVLRPGGISADNSANGGSLQWVVVNAAGRTYWLSMHVPYACGNSGVCCSSRWPIPIERSRVAAVAALRPDRAWLRPVEGAPDDVAGVIALSGSGHCAFHGENCEIHCRLGHDALPSACQHFPRAILIDPRGVFVTLSHYCPTAADLLFAHEGPVEIVEGPPAIPGGIPEGLDARHTLPPLLVGGGVRRGQVGSGVARRRAASGLPAVLMDFDGYSAWEAHMVRVLTSVSDPAEYALDQLERHFELLQQWRPGRQTLAEAVQALHVECSGDQETGSRSDLIVGRYLAARAFGSWSAYGPEGAAGVLTSLRIALTTLRARAQVTSLKNAIRQTDLEVVHLANRHDI